MSRKLRSRKYLAQLKMHLKFLLFYLCFFYQHTAGSHFTIHNSENTKVRMKVVFRNSDPSIVKFASTVHQQLKRAFGVRSNLCLLKNVAYSQVAEFLRAPHKRFTEAIFHYYLPEFM